MKKIAILGSTGSIGTQTLSVISSSSKLCVHSLVAFSNESLMTQQAMHCQPQYVGLISRDGEQCLIDAVKGCDIAVIATRGIIALDCVMYCLDNDIDIAIANKEVLVTAGSLVMSKLRTSKSRLLPVDSEHSAIWQCIYNNDNKVKRIYITASGGALYSMPQQQLDIATCEQALRHPNWNMGAKITIDSATMMNKALEVVEAHWLFGLDSQQIEMIVHRQSIIHSLVQFCDNSIIAQMSVPDMRLAIQYALTYPCRCSSTIEELELDMMNLTFEKVDFERFPCAQLGSLMIEKGGILPTIINACNDVCVEQFQQGRLLFKDVYDIIQYAIDYFQSDIDNISITVDNIKSWDSKTRTFVNNYIMENYV